MFYKRPLNSKAELLYLFLVTFFCVLAICVNLIAFKFLNVPILSNYTLSAGLLIYPITFLISDLVTELFGVYRARLMIFMSFLMTLIALGSLLCTLLLPSDPVSYFPLERQFAFQSMIEIGAMTLFSSTIAYVVSQMLDIRLYVFFKALTRNKHLWLRMIGSTLTSQIIDTLIVNILFLYCGLKLEIEDVISICLTSYLYKALFTIAALPLFYLLVYVCKRFIYTPSSGSPPSSWQSSSPLGPRFSI